MRTAPKNLRRAQISPFFQDPHTIPSGPNHTTIHPTTSKSKASRSRFFFLESRDIGNRAVTLFPVGAKRVRTSDYDDYWL